MSEVRLGRRRGKADTSQAVREQGEPVLGTKISTALAA